MEIEVADQGVVSRYVYIQKKNFKNNCRRTETASGSNVRWPSSKFWTFGEGLNISMFVQKFGIISTRTLLPIERHISSKLRSNLKWIMMKQSSRGLRIKILYNRIYIGKKQSKRCIEWQCCLHSSHTSRPVGNMISSVIKNKACEIYDSGTEVE